jgi:hypothetical protein
MNTEQQKDKIQTLVDSGFALYGIKCNDIFYTMDSLTETKELNLDLLSSFRQESSKEEATYKAIFKTTEDLEASIDIEASEAFVLTTKILNYQKGFISNMKEIKRLSKHNTLLKKSKEKRISSRRNKRKLNKKFSK